MHENLATITISCTLLRNESCRKCLFVVVSLAFISVAFHQGCSLGLDVSVSRRSRDSFAQRLGLVSVSEKCGNVSVSVSSRTESQLNVSVSSRSRASGSRLQVTIFSYFQSKLSYLCTQVLFHIHRYSISVQST